MVGLTSAVSPQQLGVQGFESSFMEGRGQPWIQGQTPSHWLLSFQTDFHRLGDSEWADREQRGQAARGRRVAAGRGLAMSTPALDPCAPKLGA